MMVHPVRMTGMVIGAAQTYDYFEMIQDRILSFVSEHSRISYDGLKALMHNTRMLTRDLGTVLVGKDAVERDSSTRWAGSGRPWRSFTG